MVSGLPTASGYEERIRFSEMEIVDRQANEQGLVINIPEGQDINGWDVNVAGVRLVNIRRTVRQHTHAEFIIQSRRNGEPQISVVRRYGDFAKLRKRLRTELPGKQIPPLPRKNKTSSGLQTAVDDVADDSSSVSSVSTQDTHSVNDADSATGLRAMVPNHTRQRSATTVSSARLSAKSSPALSPLRRSFESETRHHTLHREEQRASLRAFLRTSLQNEQIALSPAMKEFLTAQPVKLTNEELDDISRRKQMDHKRMEEQRRCYEMARERAHDLDIHMEKFRRDIVENSKFG